MWYTTLESSHETSHKGKELRPLFSLSGCIRGSPDENISIITVHISARGLLHLFHWFDPAIGALFFSTIRLFTPFLLSGLEYFYVNFTAQGINTPRFEAIING
jgi:hypothetical protein